MKNTKIPQIVGKLQSIFSLMSAVSLELMRSIDVRLHQLRPDPISDRPVFYQSTHLLGLQSNSSVAVLLTLQELLRTWKGAKPSILDCTLRPREDF